MTILTLLNLVMGFTILVTLVKMKGEIMERIAAVEAKFDEYVAAVTAFFTTIEAAKAEAVRADDAGEDDALTNLIAKIDAAKAGLPTTP